MIEDWRNWLLSQTRLPLFWVFIVYLVVDRAARLVYVFRHSAGTELLIDLAFVVLAVVFLFYFFKNKDFTGSTILLCFVFLDTAGAALILGLYMYMPGISAFYDPSLGIDRMFEVVQVVIGILFGYLLYQHWKPLYDLRQKLRSLSNDGLISFYVDTTRGVYRAWIERKEMLQQELYELISQTYMEIRRRDKTLQKLYSLLNEPDDWVRVNAARQLLRKDDARALTTLDQINEKKSEWSGWAGRMAADWRAGKLKAWP